MLSKYDVHYHVSLKSKTIRIPEIIVLTKLEANFKYAELIERIELATKSEVKFSGSGCTLFYSGDNITKYPCIGDCLENLVDI